MEEDSLIFQVYGDDSEASGTYFKSDEATDNLVWKLPGRDRFIFNTGSDIGWRIGKKENLTNESFLFKSKTHLQGFSLFIMIYLN